MQRRRLSEFAGDETRPVENEEVYEMLGWDLPGRSKGRRAKEQKRGQQ